MVLKAPCLSRGEKHACNPRPKGCQPQDKNVQLNLQVSRRPAQYYSSAAATHTFYQLNK